AAASPLPSPASHGSPPRVTSSTVSVAGRAPRSPCAKCTTRLDRHTSASPTAASAPSIPRMKPENAIPIGIGNATSCSARIPAAGPSVRTAFVLNGTATPRGSGSGGTVVPAPRPTGELGARLRVHEPGELPLRVQCLARGALQLARGRLGHRARFDEHDLLRRDADRVGDLAGDRLLHQLQ